MTGRIVMRITAARSAILQISDTAQGPPRTDHSLDIVSIGMGRCPLMARRRIRWSLLVRRDEKHVSACREEVILCAK